MFGNSKKTNQSNGAVATNSASGNSSNSSINVIGAGTKINGDLSSENDIRVDGEIVGTLTCKGKLILGPKGFVDGKVNCSTAVFEGKFKGNLNVQGLLSVKQSSKVEGEIKTGQLNVEPGAAFNVSCVMMGGKPQTNIKSGKKPEIKLQA